MKKTLFIGLGGSAQAWYRCAAPAGEAGQDWAGYVNGPPGEGGNMIAGNMREEPDPLSYENIIVQLVSGQGWVDTIKKWQKQGVRVFYECDDFMHGVHKIKGHASKSAYAPKRVKEYVKVMKVCDGLICSTEFLAEQYKKYNPNVFVAKNSLMTKLYEVETPIKEDENEVVIGWAGGTGHLQPIKSWYTDLLDILYGHSNTKFMTIGSPYADELLDEFGNPLFPKRTLSIPWTTIENYPYCMRAFDIAIAPSHDSKYFRSKSDLRWLEASAVGIPTVVNPITYPEVEDGVTGMVANNPEEFEDKLEQLILDADLRNELAQNAKKYVRENRDISVGIQQWEEILS